jgi:ribonuclease I
MLQKERNAEAPCPEVPEALLEYLEAIYPSRCLEPNESVEYHRHYAGACALVETLRHHYENQQQHPLGGDEDGGVEWVAT